MNIHSQALAQVVSTGGFYGRLISLKRIMSIIPVFILATLLTTGMIHLSPVDPAEAYLAAAHIQPTDEILAQKRHEFGLDQPFYIQYVNSIIEDMPT